MQRKSLSVKNQFLDHVLLASLAIIAAGLLAIWPIPHTIAIRNILLVIGFFLSLPAILRQRDLFTFTKSLPIIFIALLFFWLLFHYQFFSWDSAAQLDELKSVWLRAFLAACIALALALLMPLRQSWMYAIYLGIISPVLIYFYSYVQLVLKSQQLLHLNFPGLVEHKIVLGYAGILFIATSLAVFLRWLSYKSIDKYQRGLIGFFLLVGVVLSLISFVLVNTRNGIGAFIILLSVWVFVYSIQSVKLKKYFIPLAILISIIGIAGYGVHKHLKLNQQWNTFIEDVAIGHQIDEYPHWQNNSKGYPNNSVGMVNVSTYERTAWATAGIRYLNQYPLGAGVLGDSLKRMAAKNGVESHSLRFSHSGWIDLTMAIGIPGFLLILLSMLSSFYWALKSRTEIASVSIWWLLAIALYWLIAELATNKHFVEMLIFMLIFIGAVNSFSANESNPKNKLGELN